MITPNYLATVETAYQIYAIGATEAEAKQRALDAALEWLVMGEAEMERGKPYISTEEVEEYLGCNVYPISSMGVAQEG